MTFLKRDKKRNDKIEITKIEKIRETLGDIQKLKRKR